MSRYKNGLHKDLATILSGVPIPEPNRDGSRWLFGSTSSAVRQKTPVIEPPTRETFGSVDTERRSSHHNKQAAETSSAPERPEQAEMMPTTAQSAESAPVKESQKQVDIIPTEKPPQPVDTNKPAPESSLPEWARPRPIPGKKSKTKKERKSFRKIWR